MDVLYNILIFEHCNITKISVFYSLVTVDVILV